MDLSEILFYDIRPFDGLFGNLLPEGDVSFFYELFYFYAYFDVKYLLLFELLKLFTFFIVDLSRFIFYLKVSANEDFLNIPRVEGIVLLVVERRFYLFLSMTSIISSTCIFSSIFFFLLVCFFFFDFFYCIAS